MVFFRRLFIINRAKSTMKESTLNATATPMPTLAPTGSCVPESEGDDVGVVEALVGVSVAVDEVELVVVVSVSDELDTILPLPSRM